VEDLSLTSFKALVSAPPSLIYFAAVGGGILLLWLSEPKFGHRYLLLNVGLCSLLGSITVLSSSAISHFITHLGEDPSVLRSPIPYLLLPVLVSTAVLQLKHLNLAQKHFDSSAVVPVYYLSFTICSISGGGIVYQDFWRFTPLTAFGFVSGCLFCFSGVYLITKRGTVAAGRGFSEAPPAAPPYVGAAIGPGGQQLAAAICESARSVAPSRLARLGKAVSLDEGRRGVSGQRLLGEVGLPSSFSCSSGAALSDVVISDPLGDPTLGDPYLCSPPRSNSAPGHRGHGQRRAASYESPERLRELKSRRLPSRHPSRWGAEPRQLDLGGAAGGEGGDVALLGATFPRGAPHQLQRLTSGGMRRISTSISTLLDRDISVDLDATASLERGMSGHNPPPMVLGASTSQLHLSPLLARTWSPSVRRSAGGGFSAASIAEAAAAEAAAPATAGRSSSGGVMGGRGFGFRVSGLVGRPPDLL